MSQNRVFSSETETLQNPIRFEHPLNERSRTLLRLEFVFERILHYLPNESSWSSDAAISALVEAANLFSRSDHKSALIKELERNLNTLKRFGPIPGVDDDRLQELLTKLEHSSVELHQLHQQIGHELRKDDFFKSIMQRSSIPGGTCGFDLPQYHLWLNQPADKRKELISSWFSGLRPIHNAVQILLEIYRGGLSTTDEIAENGYFHLKLDTAKTTQIVTIELDAALNMFPEVSGDRHRFSIRFRQMDESTMAVKTYAKDLNFKLSLSTL